MPERERNDRRSDVYSDHKNRNRHYSPQDGGHPQYDSQGRNQRPGAMEEERGSAGDRGAKQHRQRDMTTASHKQAPAYRDPDHEGHLRLSRETTPYQSEREYHEQPKSALYNFRYVLTCRGLCQLMELFVNLLLVICAGVPYSNNGGYRDLASLGGIYHYHFGGAQAFIGADAERIKMLDQQFHQLKQPPYVFTMACGGILMVYACAMLGLGIFRVPYRFPPLLLVEALLNFLIGLGYIPALAFYLIKLQETYDNPICKEREEMYESKAHKGFSCQYHGADIAGALFGVVGVFIFIFGAVLAIRAFRSVRELKKQRTNVNNF